MTQEAAWMPGLDSATGMLTLPLWLAAAVAALLLIMTIRLVMRAGFQPMSSALPQYALVAVGVVLAWLFADRAMTHDRVEAKRALETRAIALTAQSVAPGSALACLDAAATDVVEAACERALFENAEQVSAATSYVAAQLALLADATSAKAGDIGASALVKDLRQALETDRFGVVAHVLVARHGCSAEKCEALGLLSNRQAVLTHLKDDTFGQAVARYAATWGAGNTPVAAASSPTEKATNASSPVPSNWNFPSAASIPPVSIMNTEPAAPPSASANAEPAAAPPAPQPRRPPPQRRATSNPPPAGNSVQAAPLPAPMPPAPRANAGTTPPAPQAAGAPLQTTPVPQ